MITKLLDTMQRHWRKEFVAAAAILFWMLLGRVATAEDPIAELPQAGAEDEYGSDENLSADESYVEQQHSRQNPQAGLGVRLKDNDRGAVEVSVVHPGSPAERAGIRAGDQITSIDGQRVSAYDDVRRRVAAHDANKTLRITLRRNGQLRTVEARLAQDLQADGAAHEEHEEDVVEGGHQPERFGQRAAQFGERAEAIGENLGELAAQVGEVLRDIRRNPRPRARDRYDRFEQDPEGVNDDLRVEIDRGDTDENEADIRDRGVRDDENQDEDSRATGRSRTYRGDTAARDRRNLQEAPAWRGSEQEYGDREYADRQHSGDQSTAERSGYQQQGNRARYQRDQEQSFDVATSDDPRRRDRTSRQARRQDPWRDDSRNRQASTWSRDERGASRRERAALGVTMRDDPEGGVLVSGLYPGGPAEEAGLRQGDIILRVDGRRVSAERDLVRYVQEQQPGQDVQVQVERNGRDRTFTVTLGERDDVLRAPAEPRAEDAAEAREDIRDWTRDQNTRARRELRDERLRARGDLQDLRGSVRERLDRAGEDADDRELSAEELAERDEARAVREELRDRRRDARRTIRDTRREAREAQEELSDEEEADPSDAPYAD